MATFGLWIVNDPGTAITSRPYSAAKRAVLKNHSPHSLPPRYNHGNKPAIMRFRRGKWAGNGGVLQGNLLSNKPCSVNFGCANARCWAGYTRSMPVPITAMVLPLLRNAPRWALASTPAAKPLMMVNPLDPAHRPVVPHHAAPDWWLGDCPPPHIRDAVAALTALGHTIPTAAKGFHVIAG